MLSLEKIELQFGSLAEMQAMITNADGQVMLNRPVVKLVIDVIHSGLLHVFDDTPDARRTIASGIPPSELENVIEAFTAAFTDAFGELGEKAAASGQTTVTNRAARRASPSLNGTTSPSLSSVGRKKSGKK
jgi:hypothetical protein